MRKETIYFEDFENELSDWEVFAEGAKIDDYWGRKVLWLENGLITLKDITFTNYVLETMMTFPSGIAHAGIAHRIKDKDNFELIEIRHQPNGYGSLIQYDPVFNGSNTWQLYNGDNFQTVAEVSTGTWYCLRLKVLGRKAEVYLGDMQMPALIINDLRQEHLTGFVGLWAKQPVCLTDFMVKPLDSIVPVEGSQTKTVKNEFLWHVKRITDYQEFTNIFEGIDTFNNSGWVKAWTECDGLLNLNRCFTLNRENDQACCVLEFNSLAEFETDFAFGFSDALELYVNENLVFTGENMWSSKRNGYVMPDSQQIKVKLNQGKNRIVARLIHKELPYGWGLRFKMIRDKG